MKLLVFTFLFLIIDRICYAQNFTNSSVETWGNINLCEINSPPDNWFDYTNGTGLAVDEGNFSLCPTTIPPNASNGIVYARSNARTDSTGEGMYQNIAGLIPGVAYQISFDYAGSNLWGGTNDCRWHIFIDDIDVDQTPVFHSTDAFWTPHAFVFLATDTIHKIGFRAFTTNNSGSGSGAIDNFFLTSPILSCDVNLGPDILICSSNNSILIDAGGGFSYYYWSNGNTTESISVSNVGSYSVTVINTLGCTASDTVIVYQPPSPSYSVIYFTDTLNCANALSGGIDITASGGTGYYTYLWSNGATTEDLNNLTAGIYTVTVTDSIGCIISNPPITIVQINDLAINNSSFNNLKCHDDANGFINLSEQNGLLPYSFDWNTGATTENINGLTAGTYSVTVSDAGGCTASDTVVITAPNQVIASLTTSADTIFCTVTGGTPVYHYHWNTGATTAFIDSATNGTYTVTVTDINNCFATQTIVISGVTEPFSENSFTVYPNPASEQLIISYPLSIINSLSVTDVLGRTITTINEPLTTNFTFDISNLPSGIYYIKAVTPTHETAVKKFVVVH